MRLAFGGADEGVDGLEHDGLLVGREAFDLPQAVDSIAGTITRQYDGLDDLTQEVTPQGTINYGYDNAGRRMKKTISGAITQFLYDGLNPVQELNSGNGVVANLLTGLRIDEYFSRTDTATSTFLSDALGSTIGLVGSAGSIATSYTYQPFGATT